MGKLIISIILTIFVLGIGVYIFNSNNGIKTKINDGHTSVRNTVRSFDYVTS
jgi:hypothetical protein